MSKAGAEPMVTAQVLGSLIHHLDEIGADTAALLAYCGLSRRVLDDLDAQVPLRAYVRLFEEAAGRRRDAGMGLRMSAKAGPEVLGALGFLFLSSATLGEALANLARYTAAVQDATRTQVIRKDGLAHVTYQITDDAITPRAQDAEFSIGCTYRLIRAYVGPRLELMEAHFEHVRLSAASLYESTLHCPVYFRQPTNCLVLKTADLSLSSSSMNAKLFPILESQIRGLLSNKPEVAATTADCVREALNPAALCGETGAARIAARLGVSESTLHRRLRAEGASFQALLDARRLDLARRLLADRRMNMSDVATAVGFSENAAFTRAFQRWTGRSPRDYRSADIASR